VRARATQDDFEARLERLAQSLTERAKTAKSGMHLSLSVDATGFVTVDFDKDEVITPEKLRRAMNESLIALLHQHEKIGITPVHNVRIEAIDDL
jgi:hypothetical protein